MNDRRSASPLRGRYLVRNRGWNAALRATDAILSAVVRTTRAREVTEPKKILVAIGGHLGDAVIATSVLPELERAFPSAALGMLIPSWSRAVVDAHPRLRWLHHADHWKSSRRASGPIAKWREHRTTSRRAITEVRAVGYDIAIDLYAYYPNFAWLLWRAGVPTRIGYVSGGCGPLYTTAIAWRPELGHTAAQHQALIRELSGVARRTPMLYDLPPIAPSVRERASRLAEGDYVVVHPGTGDERKAWPHERWHELIAALSARGEHVVITGKGNLEERAAADLSAAAPSVTNLVGQLDWAAFRAVVSNAKLLIGPDSVAVHAAAAAGIPTIAIMAAMSDPSYWHPLGERVAVLTRSVACAPCFRKAGCPAMTCVTDVSVGEVLAACERLADVQMAEAHIE